MAAPMNMLSRKAVGQFLNAFCRKQHGRGLRRDPKSVLTPNEEKEVLKKRKIGPNPRKNPYLPFEKTDPVQKNLADVCKQQLNRDRKGLRSKSKDSSIKHKAEISQKHIQKGVLTSEQARVIEKLDDSDKRLGQAIIRARNKKSREVNREVVLEGRHAIVDALEAGGTIKELYFSGSDMLDDFLLSETASIPVYKVKYKQIKLWSDVDQNNGIIGIFEMPPEDMQPKENCLPITVILDQLRSPANMASLLGTAEAVGCQKIFVTKGSADVWSPKVLKASYGCHFRVPILSSVSWTDIYDSMEENAQIFIVDCRKPTKEVLEKLASVPEVNEDVNIFDNEDDDAFDSSDTDISDSDASDSESEHEIITADERQKNDLGKESDPSFANLYNKTPLNVRNYDEANYVSEHTVIIVGGETEGISGQGKKLTYKLYGECVTIPMLTGAKFLNPSVAGSVILFEASRQFRQNKTFSEVDERRNAEADKT